MPRSAAWKSLNNVTVANPGESVDSLMNRGGLLGWNLRSVDMSAEITDETVDSDGNVVHTPRYRFLTPSFGVIRDGQRVSQPEVMSIRGDRYDIFTPEELSAQTLAITDGEGDGGATADSVGSIYDGKRIFVVLNLGRMEIGGFDTIDKLLMGCTSFDGSLPSAFKVIPQRLGCANALPMELRDKQNIVKFRHTKLQRDRMHLARKTLEIAGQYFADFEREANELFRVECSRDRFAEIIKAAYPERSTAQNALTRAESKRETLQGLFTGPNNDGIGLTYWGALNAMTEYRDHCRTVRDGNTESMLAGAATLDVIANGERDKLMNIVRKFAKEDGALVNA